jgi:hypothetical protein
MKAVKFHRYAQPTGTEIYTDPLGDVITVLPANSWIGITHESDGWYQVITAHHNGWIRKEDCTSGKHIALAPVIPADRAQRVMDYALRA